MAPARRFLNVPRDVPGRYARWVVRWRWPVLAASLALVGILAAFATRQHYFNPSEMWFLPTDPALVSYHRLTRQYGEHDFVIVAFREPAGIFTNRALEAIIDLTDRLERSPFAEQVLSVANYQHVHAGRGTGGEDELVVEDLVRPEELPLPPEELARRQRVALDERSLVGSLIDPGAGDGSPPTTTAVVVRVSTKDQEPDHPVRVVESILEVAREIEGKYGLRLHLAGVPVVEHAFATFGKRETLTYTSVLLGAVALLLGLIFRRVRGVLLPCAVVVLSLVGALGVMAFLRIWLNPLTTIVPQVLITVSIAQAIHVVSGFFERRRAGVPHRQAVAAAVEDNFVPCLITSLTTAIGFASLLVATLVPMRELGAGASAGVLLAWCLTFTFLPAALAVWPDWRGAPGRRQAEGTPVLDRLLTACARLAVGRPWGVLATMVAIFLGVSLFASQIRVETSYPNMFKPGTMLRQGIGFVDERLGGVVDIELSIDSGRPDGVKDPLFLAKLESIQTYLAAQPEVSQTFSILDILMRMNVALHDDDAAFARVPDSPELAAQYLLLYTLSSRREDLKDRIDVDNRWTRLSARARLYGSEETLAFADRVRAFVRDTYPGLQVNVTGKALLYTAMQEDLAASTVRAFGTAFIPITLILALLFRSLKVGILTMIPNLLPILAVFGLMGIFRIPLDPGSAMVAQVAIGIVVDDTVHFFSRYLRARRRGGPPVRCAETALLEVGRPVLYTTMILAFGFGLFAFSWFNFIAYFGQLAATVMVLALVIDLLMTPALLVASDRRAIPTSRAGV